MNLHKQQAFRALLLLAFGALLFKLHYTGEISRYINVKYSAFTQIASVLLLLLFYVQSVRMWGSGSEDREGEAFCDHGPDCGHDHSLPAGRPYRTAAAYLIILLPLVTGFFLPAATLDAAAAAKKGVLQGRESASGTGLSDEQRRMEKLYAEEIRELLSAERIVMDETKFVSYTDTLMTFPEKFKGKRIELTGFVYKEDGMGKDQLALSRFIVTHCIADASVVGFLAVTDAAAQLNPDTWIRAEGVLDVETYEGTAMPVIRMTGWTKVQPPADPYIYPEMELLVKP